MHPLRFWLISCTFIFLSWSQLKAQFVIEAFEPVKDQPLTAVFHRLEVRYGLSFSYHADLLRGRLAPAVDIEGRQIKEAVDLLLQETCFKATYHSERKHFVIAYNPRKAVFIRGYISSSEAGHPALAGVTVRLQYTTIGTNSDAKGKFTLRCTCADIDTLVISRIDLETQYLGLDSLERKVDMDIQLPPRNYTLPSVLISPWSSLSTVSVHDQGTGTLIYQPQKVRHLGMGTPDVSRSLQLLPGILATDGSASGFSIRGGSPAQNLMLYDGITLYQADHFYGALGVLNNHAVEDVTLYRGGYDARWGGRVSSVIDVSGSPSRVDSGRVGLDLNMLSASGYAEVPIFRRSDTHHAGFLVAGRLGSPTLLGTPAGRMLFDQTFQNGAIANDKARAPFAETTVSMVPALLFGDLTARAVWEDQARRFNLSATGFASRNQMHYRHEVRGRQAVEVTQDRHTQYQEGASVQWGQNWGLKKGLGTTAVVAAYSALRTTYDYDLSAGAGRGGSTYQEAMRQRSGIRDLSLRGDHGWTSHSLKHKVGLGYFMGHMRTYLHDTTYRFFSNEPDTLRELNPARFDAGLMGGAYGQYRFQVERYRFSSGLRYTHYGPTNRGYLAPRVSLEVRTAKEVRVKLAAGRYYQFLQQERAPNGLRVGEQYWRLASGDSAGVISADHFVAGLAFERVNGDAQKGNSFLFEVEAYHKRLRGLSTYTLMYNPFTTDQETDQRLTDGRGWIWGVDVLLRQRLGEAYTTWISYTALRSQQQYDGFLEGARFAADEDVHHFVKWVHVLTLGKNNDWDLTAAFSLNSGLPYTPATGVETANGGLAQAYPQVLFGPRNAARLPLRHQLDLTAAYTVQVGRKRPATLGVSLYNVYNRRNVLDRRFAGVIESPSQVPEIVAIDRYLLGILPNFFASLHF